MMKRLVGVMLVGVCGCGNLPLNVLPSATAPVPGVVEQDDSCPNDPDKTSPDECGCGVSDVDSDADGTADCLDACPNDSHKVSTGVCGCGVSDLDTDGDGTANCDDDCPNDPNKITLRACGCGFSETDTDGDLYPDCIDLCPTDPEKTDPGECGCGEPETCNAESLLVRPLDEIVVLSDLTVWDVGGFKGVTTAIQWLVDDPIEDSIADSDSDADFVLRNLRTNESVGARFIGVGSRVTIVSFQDPEFGKRRISFDDGSIWRISFSDENESRTWIIGDQAVIYRSFFSEKAINLRTGRTITLGP